MNNLCKYVIIIEAITYSNLKNISKWEREKKKEERERRKRKEKEERKKRKEERNKILIERKE